LAALIVARLVPRYFSTAAAISTATTTLAAGTA
jgi:hypothetical protein